MARKKNESPHDAARDTDPKNAGENAAVNDPNVDASGAKVGRAGEKQPREDKVDRTPQPPAEGTS